MQKAIEEAKKFVCTTKDRIVKDAKEFIQNVDWKKVAIGVAGTLAVAAVVVATGGAAAPVLIGAVASAGISTGTTVVSGVIQGKSPAEIAKDASGAFMWGAIGGAVGGGTTEVLKDVGSNVLGKVGKKLVEDGVDMALDLTQTATENGGLTGKDVPFSAVTSFGGDLVGAAKTNSTARNQLIDGATDNRAIKDAVGDSVSDASKNTTKYIDTPYGKAFQENSEEALRVKKYVEDGESFGRSNTTDAQFWAPESPLSPGYADKYGVDFKDTDYVIKGKLDPNADFITRSAPGLGNNSEGDIEIVTNPNGVKLDSFNMIGE